MPLRVSPQDGYHFLTYVRCLLLLISLSPFVHTSRSASPSGATPAHRPRTPPLVNAPLEAPHRDPGAPPHCTLECEFFFFGPAHAFQSSHPPRSPTERRHSPPAHHIFAQAAVLSCCLKLQAATPPFPPSHSLPTPHCLLPPACLTLPAPRSDAPPPLGRPRRGGPAQPLRCTPACPSDCTPRPRGR